MTEFTERYQQLTNEELLNIIANASSYQPIAVETAKQELLTRGVSEEHLNELIAQNLEAAAQQQKLLKEQQETEKTEMKALFEPVNPFQKEVPLHERQVRFMSWIFMALGLYAILVLIEIYRLNSSLSSKYDMFTISGESEKNYVSLLCFVSGIIIMIGLVLFWKRKRFGWILITFTAVSGIIGMLFNFFYNANTASPEFKKNFENIMSSDWKIMLYFVYFGFFLYACNFLYRRKTRKMFNVTSALSFLVFMIAFVLQIIVCFTYMN